MTSYPSTNGWVKPIHHGYKMMCCDCGLVHVMDFRVKGGKVQFRVRSRDNRATATARYWAERKTGNKVVELADFVARSMRKWRQSSS